ncbi:hypothetical protein SO802_035346 [Lithocarpus litseifolius]|uniref:Uncharacterized protein n=1 Tax=Lithocarpus litseifolius TaxID=425828 RepID=A0AAW2B9L1_9ROSI
MDLSGDCERFDRKSIFSGSRRYETRWDVLENIGSLCAGRAQVSLLHKFPSRQDRAKVALSLYSTSDSELSCLSKFKHVCYASSSIERQDLVFRKLDTRESRLSLIEQHKLESQGVRAQQENYCSNQTDAVDGEALSKARSRDSVSYNLCP